jgi:Ni/Fe-hydrogenase subunit HybB-like protein
MSAGHVVHEPVGGAYLTRATRILLALVALGAIAMVWRFAFGLAAVSNLNNGYPWGIWIALDVVVGTALGCGGYAVALLVYVLNKGRYHPLVRPAVLTSLLGYGLAVLAVTVDLGRPWELWKVPVFFWRWTGSPQLEVALCVATYVAVLLVEFSPAFFESWQKSPSSGLRGFATRGLSFMDRALPFILALGLVLPTMHQSSLGTMMLLPATKLHALWFTPWLPFLFLVSCLVMGYGIVVVESAFASWGFGRARETEMLARLSKVAMWVTAFWVVFRVGEVALAGELVHVTRGRGFVFLFEVALHLAAVVVLASAARRADPVWQVRAGLILVAAGTVFRLNTYLVAFRPGDHFSYFPALPELAITIGIFSLEIALYLWAVRRLPILAGGHAAGSVAR